MKYLLIILISTFFANFSSANDGEENYVESLYQNDNIFIGPQPKKSDIRLLKESQFNTVINFRTESEIEDLDFYEDYMLKKFDINYVQIPIGGKNEPYTPEKLEKFANIIKANKGNILLHCKSGSRASQFWAAYLVKYKGYSPDQAINEVATFNWWPMPLGKLLDKKLSLSIVDEIE